MRIHYLNLITGVQLDLVRAALAEKGIEVHTPHPVYIEDFYVYGDEATIATAVQVVEETNKFPAVIEAERQINEAIEEIFS